MSVHIKVHEKANVKRRYIYLLEGHAFRDHTSVKVEPVKTKICLVLNSEMNPLHLNHLNSNSGTTWDQLQGCCFYLLQRRGNTLKHGENMETPHRPTKDILTVPMLNTGEPCGCNGKNAYNDNRTVSFVIIYSSLVYHASHMSDLYYF